MYAMIVVIFFLNQNTYIELLLVNTEVTMRSVNNVGFNNAHVFVCQSYIKEIPYKPSLYVHLAKDKACAFRKRAWVKSFVLNTYIGIILHRWLGLLSTNTFGSLMKLIYHSEIKIRKFHCEFQSISEFRFWNEKPFD